MSDKAILVGPPVHNAKEALIRALANDRVDLFRKRRVPAGSPADRLKDSLIREIIRERIKLLAAKRIP